MESGCPNERPMSAPRKWTRSMLGYHLGLFIRKLTPPSGLGDDSLSLNVMIVTWLILPVVICLSQRLSHACLSINEFIL